MSVFDILIVGILAALTTQGVLWYVHLQRGEADILDLGWTACIGLLGIGYAVAGTGGAVPRLLVGLFVGVWSVRLGTHLLWDRVLRSGEDERYRTLRIAWGARANRNFLFLFLGQGLLAVLLSLPMLLICMSSETVSAFSILSAILLWAVAIVGESMADAQLKRFKADPQNRGKTCRRGLWRFSRHPNYFFEWVYWWSFVALGITLPYGWLTVIGPVLMYWFLTRLTGIPTTEARALLTRGEEYREYQRNTSAFFPWPPRE